jgi:hypothetical protein
MDTDNFLADMNTNMIFNLETDTDTNTEKLFESECF